MSLAHQSIATINSPEFINLQPMDINPLMSSCEIKVLYLGKNRNRSYISKQVATEMAKTLRGAPIVGYYKKDKEDFADHGEQMIWDDEGIHFNVLTKPYGFVAPDAKVWFQDFEDRNEFNETIIRTYLMTTGYLWTGQFQEAQSIANEGKPQSMELDETTLQGHWTTDIKEDMEFFIINDAIFSKLCILGDDVEPCFEGAGITAPQVSASFTIDNEFKQTLFSMMKELKDALEGGKEVTKIDTNTPEIQENEVLETDFAVENNQDEVDKSSSLENDVTIDEAAESTFEKQEDDQSEVDTEKTDEEKEDSAKKYVELKAQYEELESKYQALNKEYLELKDFKVQVENEQKDKLIEQFYMLSDEDKKDVIDNKTQYSLDEIESKLAVICFKKKVNFNLETSNKNEDSIEEKEPSVFTLDVNHIEDLTPDWVKAVEITMNK